MRKLLFAAWVLMLAGTACLLHNARAQVNLPLIGVGKTSGGGSCGAFPSLPGVIFRVNAQPGNFTATGTTLNTVSDISGAGNTPTVVSGSEYIASSPYNSKPALYFPNFGGLSWTSFAMGTGTNFSIYFVGQIIDSSATNFGGLFSYAGGTHTNDYDNANSVVWSRDGTADNSVFESNSTASSDQAFTAGTNVRLGFTINSTNGIQYKNGTGNTAGAPSLSSGFQTSGHMGLGVRWVGGSFGTQDNLYIVDAVAANSNWSSSNFTTLDTWYTCTYGS
jgi:hypothetical protein